MCARDIEKAGLFKSPAYRIALAAAIPSSILDVRLVDVKLDVSDRRGEKFVIAFMPLAKDAERQEIGTPLLSDYSLGGITRKIWDRWEPDGTNHWVGKRMMLYKHNNPPREGDRSAAGYRCCVYAEPLE